MSTVAQPCTSSPALDIEEVYRKHGHHVLRRARQILRSEQEAAEVLQDVFLSLMRDPAQYHGRSRITTWLYRVTTNLCLNRIRNHSNRARLMEERVAPAAEIATAPAPSTVAMARQLIARMPETLAQVALYHWVDGMTHDEIAEVMDCSPRQIGKLIARATCWARDQEKVP
jgi:RNA polymerase sigma-70 factor (ECF subfamily)